MNGVGDRWRAKFDRMIVSQRLLEYYSAIKALVAQNFDTEAFVRRTEQTHILRQEDSGGCPQVEDV
jgi:hypothetical protein